MYRVGWMKKTARLMAADRLESAEWAFHCRFPCAALVADVEAGAAAKYAKAPGLRDVIQIVFGWSDSPCGANWAATDAVEPPARGIAARGGSPTP